MSSRAECVVDLAAISRNVTALGELAAPAAVLAVVKADGYGHGLLPAARAALDGGASWLGVAFPEEALALRAGGVTAPVLAFIVAPAADLPPAILAQVDLGIGSLDRLGQVVRAAATVGRPARLHLEVDTGLGRGGAPAAAWSDLVDAAAKAQADGSVEVLGVWSHLARADEPGHPVTVAQTTAFRDALGIAERAGLRPELRHLANSAGLLAHPETRFDLVRPGIAVYGLAAGAGLELPAHYGLRPAMTVRAQVALAKRVPAGHGVSYGHRYLTSKETTLALVPAGYGDGVPRAAGNTVDVAVNAVRYRIAGTVCMDQFVIDVGDDPVVAGDEVVMFGPGDAGEPTADEWAAGLGTIGYEIVTRVGSRLPRHYVAGRA